MKRLLLLVPTLMAMGPFTCSPKVTWRDHSFASRDLSRAPAEVKLPPSLWEKIELLGTKAGAESEGGGSGGGEAAGPAGAAKETHAKSTAATVFAPVKVFLVEKNSGILQAGHTEIEFGPGGGELDFRDFVQPHNGSFYFIAEFMPELEEATRRIYYMSNAETRKLGNENYGAGCDTYFDVTSAFDKAAKGTGFLVNTTEGRHISALAGNYFFAAAAKGKLYLASVTIKDTGKREKQTLQCKR